MSAPATLRPATPADWLAVAQLLTASQLPLAGAEAHLTNFIVALTPDALVGVAGLEAHGAHGLLRSVAVDERLRGQRLAEDLVRAVITRARALHLQSLTLLTTTAAGYFPRFGFVTIPREQAPAELATSEELRGACPASAVTMTLPLS